jgi:DNA-binding transcriptional ArsR family regulator
MLQGLSEPEVRGPEGITLGQLGETLHRLFDLPATEKSTSDERQRVGAERGRRKGTAATKAKGAATAARIVAHLEKTGAKPIDRGLAQKIARVLGMNRSTVSRHLNKLKKRK